MRNYKKKVKLYSEATIEIAMSEVKAGASVKRPAIKYHMSRHMLKMRLKEDAGEFSRKRQVFYSFIPFFVATKG